MASRKEEIITFKVDHALAEELRHMPNRSDFIRQAVLRAMENVCPLCGGTGVLTASQMDHWHEFERHHHLEECETCHEAHLVCDVGEEGVANHV